MTGSRALGVLAVLLAAGLIGACAGTPGPTARAAPSGSATAVASTSPFATVAATAKPSPSAAVAVRPGFILLDHIGNALDGTPLKETEFVHLWLVKADGSALHELAPGQPTRKGVVTDKGAGDWSPDGTHIVFASQSQIPLIYETDVAGATPRLISTDCAFEPVSCFDFFPAYSPDGKRIAFVRLTDDGASGVLAVRDLATAKVTILESTRQGPPKNELGAPAWSPDGARLVYFEVSKGAEGTPPASSELFIVNADGTGRHRLVTPGLAAGDPRWSPDGSTIAFSIEPIRAWADQNVDDHPDVYVVHPDGTGLKQLTQGGGSGAPSWTSDGKIFYFSERELWLMDADGANKTYIGPGNLSMVSDMTGFSYYARWQPVP